MYFFYFIRGNVSLLNDIANISLSQIALIFMLKTLNLIFMSNININILNYLKIELSQRESLELTIKNTLGNLTAPFKLGTGYKVSYLKDNYKFKISDFIYWNTFFTIFNLLPLAICYILFGMLLGAPLITGNKIESISLTILITALIFLIPKSSLIRLKEKKFRVMSKRNLLIQLNYILFYLSSSVIVLLIASNFSENLKFFSSLSYNFLGSFVGLVNLTPGNLGIKEAVIILFDNIHKISFQVVIITSFIERLFSFIAIFSTYTFLKLKRDK